MNKQSILVASLILACLSCLFGITAIAQTKVTIQSADLRLIQERAEQGDADAQAGLGEMYALGKGMPVDFDEARIWYLKAAKQGHAEAQNRIGAMYANGQGGSQDFFEARKWYRLGAEQGLSWAQYNLAGVLIQGQGGPHGFAEARELLLMTAEKGL